MKCKCGLAHAVVVDRECNYSAFSGYRRTSSDYSLIRCVKCGTFWRTKAQYVASLPDSTRKQAVQP